MREAAGGNLAERTQTARIGATARIAGIVMIVASAMIVVIETAAIETAVMIVNTEPHPENKRKVSRE